MLARMDRSIAIELAPAREIAIDGGIVARALGLDADEFRRRLLADASEEIAKVQQSAGTHVEAVVESGDVSKAVGTAAGRLNSDLVVVGRGAVDNARLRTNAYGIIRESPCPVVSV